MRQKRSFSVEQTDVSDILAAYGSIPLKTVIKKYTETELTATFQSLFTHNNDSVLDLINQAKNIGDQSKVLEAMRLVRLQKDSILSKFFTFFSDVYARQLLSNHAAGPSIEDYIYNDEIYSNELLGDEVLEIRAAVDKMADNIKRRQWEVQSSLSRRFSILAGHSYDVNNYPLSPWTVCESFAKVVSGLKTSLAKKLIILKIFEYSVIPNLEHLNFTINDIMIADGVTQLEDSNEWISDTPVPEKLASSNTLANADIAEQINSVTKSELDYNVKRFVAMQEMLHPETTITVSESSDTSTETIPGEPYYSIEEVITGLSVLQEKILILDHKEVIANNSNVRRHLAKLLNVMNVENTAAELDRKSSDVVDIVSMMFDFILDDASLPLALRSIMIRLQIPIIKVAIIEDEFFSSRLQSARQLLNEFAYSANVLQILSQNGDKKEKVIYKQIERVVDVILKDFTMDVGIFLQQLHVYQKFMRSVLQDRKDKTKKIKFAKDIVVKEIEQRLSNQDVPPVVAGFIKNIWNQVLTKVAIRTHCNVTVWNDILGVTDDLIWSAQPKLMEQERRLLVSMIPRLLNRLQDGLCLVKYSEDLIAQFFVHMEEIHLNSMRGIKNFTQILPLSESRENMSELQNVNANVNNDNTSQASITYYEGGVTSDQTLHSQYNRYASGPVTQESKNLLTVTEMQLGTWVEFSTNKRIIMGKLEWRCDFTGEFRFVDRNNTIVHSTNLQNLVSLFDHSQAKLNDDVPLFDRAVDAVYVGLQAA